MDPAEGGPDVPETTDGDGEGLGPRGVVLVVTLLLSVLGIPALIYWRPPQLPFVVSYLILPLVPAVVLGLVAVWSLTESDPRSKREQ